LQLGQANPGRRGSFSRPHITRALRNPPQQTINMKTEIIPSHMDCIHNASPKNAVIPTNPKIVAAIKLRARPTKNHNSDRNIWPPSSG
jgi:hypothetical protein